MRARYRLLLALVPLAALAAWLPNVSVPGRRVEGCAEGCSTGAARDGASVRVLTLNVLHGFPRFEQVQARLDRIAGEIRSQGVDVALLQEVPWTPALGSGAEYLARQTGLNHVYVRANGNRRAILFEEGVAILSRYPLRDATFTELWPRAGRFEHRVALLATVATPGGDVDVVATHLTHGEAEANRRQAAALQEWVGATARHPALVAGDFNATEDSPQVRQLARMWRDAYRAANPTGAGLTCCVDDIRRGAGERLEKRIDYMFLVPGPEGSIAVRDARVVLDRPFGWEGGRLWPSDHAGLVVDLDLSRQAR